MPALPDRINGAIKRGTDIVIEGPEWLSRGRLEVAFADAVGVAVRHPDRAWKNVDGAGFEVFIPWTAIDSLTVVQP